MRGTHAICAIWVNLETCLIRSKGCHACMQGEPHTIARLCCGPKLGTEPSE